jgi:hypothetical protein
MDFQEVDKKVTTLRVLVESVRTLRVLRVKGGSENAARFG